MSEIPKSHSSAESQEASPSRFVSESRDINDSEVKGRREELGRMWDQPTDTQLEELFTDVSLEKIPKNEFNVASEFLDPNKDENFPVKEFVDQAVGGAADDQKQSIQELGALRRLAGRIVKERTPNGGEEEWKQVDPLDKKYVRFAEMMDLAAQAGLIQLHVEQKTGLLEKNIPAVTESYKLFSQYSQNTDIPRTFKEAYLQPTIDLIKGEFPDIVQEEQSVKKEANTEKNTETIPVPPEYVPDFLKEEKVEQKPQRAKWNVIPDKQTPENKKELDNRRLALEVVLNKKEYPKELDAIIEKSQTSLDLSRLKEMADANTSPFHLVLNKDKLAESADIKAVQNLGVALLARYASENKRSDWNALDIMAKHYIRIGEMLVLESQKRKIERILKGNDANYKPSDKDKNLFNQFKKIATAYLESDDIPAAFKERLREANRIIPVKYDSAGMPVFEAIPVKAEKAAAPPEAIPVKKPITNVTKKSEAITAAPVSNLNESITMKRNSTSEQITTIETQPLQQASFKELSNYLNNLSPLDRTEHYRERALQLESIRESISAKDLEIGAIEAENIFTNADNIAEEYKDQIKNAIKEMHNDEKEGILVVDKNGKYAQRFIASLGKQLTYEKQSRWGKFWTRAKVFGLFQTALPQWLGGSTKKRIEGVRDNVASTLYNVALQKNDKFFKQLGMGKADKYILARIANKIDGVNKRVLQAKQ